MKYSPLRLPTMAVRSESVRSGSVRAELSDFRCKMTMYEMSRSLRNASARKQLYQHINNLLRPLPVGIISTVLVGLLWLLRPLGIISTRLVGLLWLLRPLGIISTGLIGLLWLLQITLRTCEMQGGSQRNIKRTAGVPTLGRIMLPSLIVVRLGRHSGESQIKTLQIRRSKGALGLPGIRRRIPSVPRVAQVVERQG